MGLTVRPRESNAALILSMMRSKQTLSWRELLPAIPCITASPRSLWYVGTLVGFLKLHQQGKRREFVLIDMKRRNARAWVFPLLSSYWNLVECGPLLNRGMDHIGVIHGKWLLRPASPVPSRAGSPFGLLSNEFFLWAFVSILPYTWLCVDG